MENNQEVLESLLESITDYLKTNVELIKLNVLDKASDGISSFVPHTVVFALTATFFLFVNVGLSLWIGDMLGRIYLGFLAVSAFYGLTGLIVRLFFFKHIKQTIKKKLCQTILHRMD